MRSIVLYVSETCTLRKTEELKSETFETEVLRKIDGSIVDSQINERRQLHNSELQRQFRKPNVVKEIAKRRLMWAGYRDKDL